MRILQIIRRAATLVEAQGTRLQPVIRVGFGGSRCTGAEYIRPAKNHPGAGLGRAVNQARNQQGALFGLDARIALAIFSILSVVAGVAVVVNIDSTRAQVLATELSDTTQALESFHHDLKTDIFLTLTSPSGKNAYQALYDNAVVTDGESGIASLRARWNGPYIKFTSTLNPRYGDMSLTKAGADHTQPCNDNDLCYLYIVYSRVKPGIATEANKSLDGEAEKAPEKEGRLQWTAESDQSVILHYRAFRALSQFMDY